nr:vacuolar protein sorting-associated protein 52 A-like isoform X1 [Ipomoea batatas]
MEDPSETPILGLKRKNNCRPRGLTDEKVWGSGTLNPSNPPVTNYHCGHCHFIGWTAGCRWILSKNLKFAEGVPMVKSSKALKDVQLELEKLRQKSISKLTAGDQASRRRPTTEWARVEASDWTTVVFMSLASAGWWAVARQSIEPTTGEM